MIFFQVLVDIFFVFQALGYYVIHLKFINLVSCAHHQVVEGYPKMLSAVSFKEGIIFYRYNRFQ